MKQISKILGSILGLASLVVLAVVLALIFSRFSDKQTPAISRSALQSPTSAPMATATPMDKMVPSPTATLESKTFESPLPTPTMTSPKPTKAPIPTPTITPVPTRLSLPRSAFYALWAENWTGRYGENCCKGSILWLADPGDVGSRQEVLRIEHGAILEAALSPDNHKIALVTSVWPQYFLWIADMDGTNLQQIDVGTNITYIGDLFWSRDSSSLAYGLRWQAEVIKSDTKSGTPVPIGASQEGVEVLSVRTNERKRILDGDPGTSLTVLGWSANGQDLYYQCAGQQYEVWAISANTRVTRNLFSLSVDQRPILSPASDKFMIIGSDGVTWIPVDDGQDKRIIAQPERGLSAIWASDSQSVVLTRIEKEPYSIVVQSMNVQTRSFQDIGIVNLVGNLRFLSVSPDYHWLAVYHYDTGLHWIHLPSETIVPIPQQGLWRLFVGWVPNIAASD